MYCLKCGSAIREGDKFCPYCGSLVSASEGKKEKGAENAHLNKRRPRDVGKTGRRLAGSHGGKGAEGPNGSGGHKVAIFAALAAVILLAVAGVFFLPGRSKGDGAAASGQADETAVEAMNTASTVKEAENMAQPEMTSQAENMTPPESASQAENTPPETVSQAENTTQAGNEAQTEGTAAADHETVSQSEGVPAGQEETVKGAAVPGVPESAFYYSFNNKELGGAKAVFREGNTKEGYNSGTLPQIDENLIESYTDGVDGKALFLNGSYGVVMDDITPMGNNYTIGFWVRPDRYENFTPMIEVVSNFLNENNDSRWIVLNKKTDENGNVLFPVVWSCDAAKDMWLEFHPAYTDGTSSLANRKWYYIALTVNGDIKGKTEGSVTATLYVNGQKVGSGDAAPETFVRDGTKIYLGINCWDVLFQGAFDEIKIWDKALSDAQISGLYKAYGYNS